MDNLEVIYADSLAKIQKISSRIQEDLDFTFDFDNVSKSESSLDASDYCFAFLFGFLGAFISTNKRLEKYLADIHKAASEAPGDYDKFQILMGKLLHHKGDTIDKMSRRDGAYTDISFHRLLWGHDVFSTKKDNPFSLMISQTGTKIGGILQALRHLIADTMSKQGLPAPGTAIFDYVNGDGKTTNYIIDLVQGLSEESFGNKAMAQEIYSHLFTIRAQDIASGTLAKILTELYFKIKGIETKVRRAQMLFMVYAINFFTEAVVGAVKQKGVPYINIPVGTMMIVAFAKLCYWDRKDTIELTKRTAELSQITDQLIEKYEFHSLLLPEFSSADQLLTIMDDSDSNMSSLIDFLGGTTT